MRRVYLATICSVFLAGLVFVTKHNHPANADTVKGEILPLNWVQPTRPSITESKDTRAADETFLTFPEWFLVFSPEEQGQFFEHRTATTFPYWSHVVQFWSSYNIVHDQIKNRFPTNYGYHFMIWVIGLSTTAEYTLKEWYETCIGRLTDTGSTETPEDRFEAEFTKDYVKFIKVRPWYEYDFLHQLRLLWQTPYVDSDHLLRRIERKYFLSSELIAKYGYGKVITLGTHEVYNEASDQTAVVLEDGKVHYLRRYDAFKLDALELVASGHSFTEVAGNDSAILLSCLVPSNNSLSLSETRTILSQSLSSDPSRQRVVLAVPVSKLHFVLQHCVKYHVSIEHVFDF